jgi:hypothetical protein
MHRSRSVLLLPLWSVLVAAATVVATLGWHLRPAEAAALAAMLAAVGIVDQLLANDRG